MTTITSRSVAARVASRASRQAGVVNASQLRDVGASRNWTSRAVRDGLLIPVEPRVYVMGAGSSELGHETCTWVGLRSTSGHAALIGPSAAERLGIWDRPSSCIHVGSPSFTHRRLDHLARDTTVELHRSRWLNRGITVDARGMPSADAMSTILTLGRHLGEYQIAYVIYRAVFKRLIDIHELQMRLAAMPTTPWTRRVRRAVDLFLAGSVGAKSRSEDEVVYLLQNSTLTMPQVNVLGATGHPGHRLDFVWRLQRVVLEIDGGFHKEIPGIAENDEEVSKMLERDAWHVLRFSHRVVWTRPNTIMTALERALGQPAQAPRGHPRTARTRSAPMSGRTA